MKTLILAVLVAAFVLPASSQTVWTTPGVGSVAATWAKLYIGPPNMVKTLDFVSYESGTDTIKFTYWRGDTGNIGHQNILLPSQTLRDYNVKTDTIWYKGTGTSNWFVRAAIQ